MRLYAVIVAWLIAVLSGFFAVAGAQLAFLGGSPYYLIAGIAMVASGAMMGRHDPLGRTLFLAVWLATVIWACGRSGWSR